MDGGTTGSTWQLRLLDHFTLEGPTGTATISSRKTMALLAYLTLQRGRAARRDAIASLLWENVDTAQARVNLRQSLSHLRKLDETGSIILEATLDTIRLTPEMVVDVDVFEQLEFGDPEAAISIYKTDLMAGFVLRDAPAFNEWLSVIQAHWRQRLVGTLLRLIATALEDGGDLNSGVVAALKLLSFDPYNEAGHRALMRTYARQGRSALGIAQYRSLSDLLRRELGVAPEAETQREYETLRSARRTIQEPVGEIMSPSPSPVAAEAQPNAVPVFEKASKRIAVVDDETNLRDPVAAYLRLSGFEVVECASGSALDAAMAEMPVDLIVLDVTMPGEDGFSIARRINAAQRVPIIMLTARTDLVDRVVGLEVGADDYLGKPFEFRELLARIRAVLRRSET